MLKYIVAIALMAVMATPVFAQQKKQQEESPYAIEQKEKKKEADRVDKQYKDTLKRTDQEATAVRVDPWQNMRGSGDATPKH